MSLRLSLATAALAMTAAPAMAGNYADGTTVPLYAYPASANYCPAGLQPVILGGVICCGVPNTHTSYTDMMRHPAGTRSYTVRPTYFDTPGIKGTGG